MRNIAIVGAGQAGAQLALGLQGHGYEVTLVSDRTPDEIRTGVVMSSQVMFESAMATERAHGLNLWDDQAPAITGIRFTIRDQDGAVETSWHGPLDGRRTRSTNGSRRQPGRNGSSRPAAVCSSGRRTWATSRAWPPRTTSLSWPRARGSWRHLPSRRRQVAVRPAPARPGADVRDRDGAPRGRGRAVLQPGPRRG
jgi:hypothetical protein